MLNNDPLEKKNVIDQQIEIKKIMENYLDEWTRQCDELRKKYLKSQKRIKVDEKTKEKLKALGYIN